MFTNNYIPSHLSIHSTFALYPTMFVQAPPVIACIWTSSASSFEEHLVKSCGNKFKQMPFTLKDLTKVAFHIEGFHVSPKRYPVHCLEACFRGIGLQSTSLASRQLYEIDGGLVMEMVKDFLGTLQMVAHLFRKMRGMDFTIFMCYYFLVFHESQCLLTFLSWGFLPKKWGCENPWKVLLSQQT
jgi:hypothetical protein